MSNEKQPSSTPTPSSPATTPTAPAPSAASQRREKKRIENEGKIEQAMGFLNQVMASHALPKSVRKKAREAMETLEDKKTPVGIRAANAVSLFEELSRDPNVASFSRVTIWSAISTLESVREA
jgi:uncharacterized protein (UPF0147 family)